LPGDMVDAEPMLGAGLDWERSDLFSDAEGRRPYDGAGDPIR
jgi:hypothetical protein